MTKINDVDEIQFRQVHPNWIEDGEPSRLVFKPTKKDDNKLSLDRSASTNAKASFERFTELGLQAACVYGLTVGEFESDPFPIECYESPLPNNPHHSHADFTGLSNSQQRTKAQQLRRMAISRGKLFPFD